MIGLTIASGALLAAAPAEGPKAEPWGTTRGGEQVEQFTLVNARGMRVRAISWGATLAAVEIPDGAGHLTNVVLNLPDIASYERTTRRWAGIVGRYAGRIDQASFALDGARYALEPGRNGVTLHSGSRSYDHRVWQAEPFSDAGAMGVTFRLDSADHDQGFPGHLRITVTYRLARTRNELRVDYRATSDRPTVLNLTNHGFWNLAGGGSALGQMLRLDADRYAEMDARKVPTGRLLPVTGTPRDFRRATPISVQNAKLPDGLDESLALRPAHGLRWAATLVDPVSGRRMDVATTEPSIQLNSGGGFDGSEVGGKGTAYQRWAGIALEMQHLPDSPHHPAFPSTVLRPGQIYRATTVYRFSSGK